MKLLTIAGANLRRFLRDRSNIFFVFVFPMLLVLTIGVVFGGDFDPRIGVVAPATPLADELVDSLAATDGLEVVRAEDRAGTIEEVERGSLNAMVEIPGAYDEALLAGGAVELGYVAAAGFAEDLRLTVQSAVVEQATRFRAAGFVADRTGGDLTAGLAAVDAVSGAVGGVDVTVVPGGEVGFEWESAGRFDLGAAQELALFVFLTSLTGSTQLILTRQLGVATRMLATPTGMRTVLGGELLGRFSIALVQALFIVVASSLLFGVSWGDPWGAALLVVAFAFFATGCAMLLGSVLHSEQQAGGIGVTLGMVFAALGGAMVPIEIFSDQMRRIAHITPHAWVLDGFRDLIVRGGGVGDVLNEVAVLAGAGALIVAVATWALRRSITG